MLLDAVFFLQKDIGLCSMRTLTSIACVGDVIAHVGSRKETNTLAVLFHSTAALKRHVTFRLAGEYHISGSAFNRARFISKNIPAC